MYSSSLPPGCTESMCEPDDPTCASCGCRYSDHYYEDGEEPFILRETCERYSDADGIWYYPDGQVANACMLKNHWCEKFIEGEYEPDYDDYRDDRD